MLVSNRDQFDTHGPYLFDVLWLCCCFQYLFSGGPQPMGMPGRPGLGYNPGEVAYRTVEQRNEVEGNDDDIQRSDDVFYY